MSTRAHVEAVTNLNCDGEEMIMFDESTLHKRW